MNIGATLQKAFELVLEASFSASILALIIALVQWALRGRLSPAWRFALWTPVLLRLFVPVLPESALSLFNAPRWYATWRHGEVKPVRVFWLAEEREAPPTLMFGDASAGSPVRMRELRQVPQTLETGEHVGPVEYAPVATETENVSGSPWWANARSLAAVVWICGLIVLLGRLAIGTLWLAHRLRREAHNTPQRLKEIMGHVARAGGFRIEPRVRETHLVGSPALFGLWRPVLLLPTGFSERLTETEIRHVFLHELAHLKRRDLVVNWLMSIGQAVHWFNPVVWLVFRRMRLERELACDEMALRACSGADPKAYGETILRLLEGVSSRRALSAMVGIAEEKHSAKRRLQQIAIFRPGTRKYGLGVVVLIALALAGLTNAQGPKREAIQEDVPKSPDKATPAAGSTSEAVGSSREERPGDATVGEPITNLKAIGFDWYLGNILFAQANERQHNRSDAFERDGKTLEKTLATAPIDSADLEGLTLTEAVNLLREKMPADLRDISIRWHQTTNLTSGRAEADHDGRGSPLYSVNAVGYIEAEIGKHPSPGDEIHLSHRHLSATNAFKNLNLRNFWVEALLNMIVDAAEKPVQYTIRETAIVFSSVTSRLRIRGREDICLRILMRGRIAFIPTPAAKPSRAS